ncbi:Transposon Ty3-G Gag-Pol polyprotein [Labeo rohita]|uniref:ribonuclease H n=1 Tax=Labeo rohita TaxID=84645 RepID=A0ABQ8LTS0_LABRO|nr:Transposon Ty3-G Gag-Pol polyprotein [Labeo rohita]
MPRRSLTSAAAGRTETRGTLGRGPPRRGPTVLQGTAASDEHLPRISPPGIVAEPGCSSPPRGSLEQLARQSPAGPPLQVSELVVQSIPEASLKRLVPLVDYLAAWKLLPNVSAWVLHTVEKGYAIQFGAPPPPFDWVFPTLVGPEQALVMEQEVETLLRKEAIEVVPPHARDSGFYSRYFIVPKKDGGLRPIIDLRRLNRSVMKLKIKMLTVKQVVSQIRSKDWFVTIDLKDAYFHASILPQHRKFLRFAFRGEAYQYRVLPFGLALSPHTFTKCVDAALVPLRLQGIRILNYRRLANPRTHENVGVKTKRQEKCAFSITEDHLSGRGVGFDHDAGTFVSCSDRVDPRRSQESQRGPVTHCQAVSTTAGSNGSCVQRDTFWPAVHETPTVVAQIQGVFPEGKPALHDQGHAPRATCLRYVEEAVVPNQGPVLGAPCRRVTLATDASLTGWGAVMSGHSAQGLWTGRHLSWHINCLEMLAVFRALKYFLPDLRDRHVLVCTDSTAVVYYINHQGGLRSRPLYKLAHQILVWSQDKLLSLRAVHIPGHLNVGADILSRQGPRPGEWMLHPEVFIQLLWLRLSPDCSAPGSSRESTPGRGQPTISSPVLAGPSMVLGPDISSRRLSMGDSRQEGSPLTGAILHPRPELWKLWTVLLLALTSLKRVGDLQALSVAPSHLELSPGMIKAFLYPRLGYVPKVPNNTPQPVVLQAFCPPPFREPDQQKLNCMCPVRALDAYVHRAALWRNSEQLFVCYGPPKKRYPASKETLSRWIVDAISTAYESSDLPSPLGVKAHSTRAIGASKLSWQVSQFRTSAMLRDGPRPSPL